MSLKALQKIVGPDAWTTDPHTLEKHSKEWRGEANGRAAMVVFPRNVDEVAAVVKTCGKYGIGIVPQGGNTGMCAGAVPDKSGEQIVLALTRMDAIRSIDADNFSMEVEAGCILANVQSAALDADRLFALSLGAEGSCQIGGNLSTNAGGINVLRYGTARAQVLGLEVVLADGTVVDGMRSLRKDTAGYDLKQMFIGSEGTLGIITAATLKLFPVPTAMSTALVALNSAGDAIRLLGHLRSTLGDRINAFELLSDFLTQLIEKHIPGVRLPFDKRYPWYVLLEAESDSLESLLGSALNSGLLLDAVLAKNLAESEELWRMRHSTAEAEREHGKALKHDISVPSSRMAEFLDRGEALLNRLAPEGQLIAFGHVGDGNLHYNLVLPEYDGREVGISTAIYDLVAELGGSFSAEHGVGSTKRAFLAKYRGGPEIELMRTLKKALDPNNILNPGKVI